MKKTGQVFFFNDKEELFLAQSFEDENHVVTTAHIKIESEEDFTRYPEAAEFLKLKKLKKHGHAII
jgi:hypothetical protein